MERIYLSPPDMGPAEREALMAAFDSGWVAPVGPDLAAFEAEMAEFLGLPEGGAVALSSGTAALHLSLRMLGVGPGDEVWTSTLTFAATANAIVYEGATPVFIDADPATWQMDPSVLEKALASAAEDDRLPAAVVPVDLYGQACDYDRILAACDAYDIPVVEDAAEALGTTYRGKAAGTFGRSAALSFNGNKLITSGGGGMLLSQDVDVVSKARYLATQAREPVLHYEHQEVGFNYRLSNLLAAVGRAQLARVPELIERRKQIRAAYEEALCDVAGVSFMPIVDYGAPNHWLTCILLDPPADVSPHDLCDRLAESEIEARPLWKPMHRQPVFEACHLHSLAPEAATADRLFSRGLCLPSGSSLTESNLDRVIQGLRSVLL
ncbi:Lipopolysaccharide biosynthesis protein RffA [Euzebya pacifica]|uniref:Lipopolysaccharide biosynthesis protein RffA n=1 Tax=Euzebya pacifica TaxID=1608957 RepID=A0A346Y189_9ACTN|nr:aminotransferase class I/II-fold pyridoxal phosphate-dependent enzyme [Euzebya pacifica]AXV08236.1 Lipopolysaccharide biosynthesis protein RffA [Euzebya pacifica]